MIGKCCVGNNILLLSLIILRHYKRDTSVLNSLILHQQTDYKCRRMSDCPYTGKTLLEKRELPLLPPNPTLDKDEIAGASHQAVSQTEELSGATASPGEFRELTLLPHTTLDKIWELSDQNKKGFLDKQDFLVASQLWEKASRGEILPDEVVLPSILLTF